MAAGDALECLNKIGEAAAETATGDLIGLNAVGLHEVCVNEVVALIVEDYGDVGAAPLNEFGGGQDQGGLAGSRKPPIRAMVGLMGGLGSMKLVGPASWPVLDRPGGLSYSAILSPSFAVALSV